MRIEVNDEASQLRLNRTIVKCAAGCKPAASRSEQNRDPRRDVPQLRECRDCGGSFLSCRCRPGEG